MAATLERETAATGSGDWRTMTRLVVGQPASDGAGERQYRAMMNACLSLLAAPDGPPAAVSQ